MIDKLKVAFFDIDGTLHHGDTIWEAIHKKNNTWETKGKLYLKQYLKNEISFEEFAYLDVRAWTGVSEELVMSAVEGFCLYREAIRMFSLLKAGGVDIFLVSNSLSVVAKRIVEEYGLAGYIANDLVIEDGILTGELIINIGYSDKGKHVNEMLGNYPNGLSMAVGDGGNDLLMLKAVDVPILYNPTGKDFPGYDGYMFSNWESIMNFILD